MGSKVFFYDAFADGEAMKSWNEKMEKFKEAVDRLYSNQVNISQAISGAVSKIDLTVFYSMPDFKVDTADLTAAFSKAYSAYAESLPQIEKSAQAMKAAIAASAWNKVVESVEAARPYLTDEQAEAVEEIVAPAAGEDPHTPKRLTLGQWGTILSIILAIIQVILMFRPDPQLDEISDQNEVIIQQQAEQAEILRQLTDTASDICDILETFQQHPDQSEAPADLVGLSSEDLAETPDDDGESKHLDADADDSEALDQQDDRDR